MKTFSVYFVSSETHFFLKTSAFVARALCVVSVLLAGSQAMSMSCGQAFSSDPSVKFLKSQSGVYVSESVVKSEFLPLLTAASSNGVQGEIDLENNKIGPGIEQVNQEFSNADVAAYDFELLFGTEALGMTLATGIKFVNTKTGVEQVVLSSLRRAETRDEVTFYWDAASQDGMTPVQLKGNVLGQDVVVTIPSRVQYKIKYRHSLDLESLYAMLAEGAFSIGEVRRQYSSTGWEVEAIGGGAKIRAYFTKSRDGSLMLRTAHVIEYR